MRTFASLLGVATLSLFLSSRPVSATDPVIVHEWGTFTCLQDENGNAIGGINVDDEPVPRFVWGWESLHHATGGFGLPPYNDQCKGWRPHDADVTMRLETPVLYFYPPKGTPAQSVPPLDVYVKFRGGALTQYYPCAVADGLPDAFPYNNNQRIGQLNSGLTWKGVRLGSTVAPVATDDKVWSTPRDVSAPILEVPSPVYDGGQMHLEPLAEHFLFYRGLGHLDSPLEAGIPKEMSTILHVCPRNGAGEFHDFGIFWLADIRNDGTCAFGINDLKNAGTPDPELPGWIRSSDMGLDFAQEKFSKNNLTKLNSSMHDALMKEGLYDDEATAMLKTWELSYFKSPGLRLFYIVPRKWVDKELPLTITGAPTQIARVMVGRIELISDAQRAALARLSAGPCPKLFALKDAADTALRKSQMTQTEKMAYYNGEKPLSDLGIAIPPFVQDYLSLGRFRDALIVHEQKEHPSTALEQFIKDNGLATEETGFRTIGTAGP